ncbi:cytochrome c biogenesis protein CcdA [Paeniroseomonas aquatica]|uniref:Cytochrome c biogenesis protein CcdA n=1 Tax=Paeniroseomonas aquatica TaxID=373043 RepID=A0ABT8A1N4_9PROT|nr:cytochrome c biogenesis protein CcdA [Paeniroseomonas aquatica]MDN3563536.1 cytochrome c biogenesis protein CcdA [Paeniroseomonas aquatica]
MGLGLLGFVEPCSVGSTLLVVKHMEGRSTASKVAQVGAFAGTRAVFIGLLGMLAALLGAAFLDFQRAAWVILGAVYVLIGLTYLLGRSRALMVSLGPGFSRLSGLRGSAALGIALGFNIPACAGPLLVALLGAAAAGGASGAALASGFVSLAFFGLALSLPLVLAVLFEPARRALDRLAGMSQRLPFWTGLLLVALGAWSIWLGLSGFRT